MADTVPAMLEPGEYVIKKSAAKKIGYKNLNKMNRGGKMPKAKYSSYKKGGKVKKPSVLEKLVTQAERFGHPSKLTPRHKREIANMSKEEKAYAKASGKIDWGSFGERFGSGRDYLGENGAFKWTKKGGAYPRYKKGERSSIAFNKAFASAKESGKKNFMFQGRKYEVKTNKMNRGGKMPKVKYSSYNEGGEVKEGWKTSSAYRKWKMSVSARHRAKRLAREKVELEMPPREFRKTLEGKAPDLDNDLWERYIKGGDLVLSSLKEEQGKRDKLAKAKGKASKMRAAGYKLPPGLRGGGKVKYEYYKKGGKVKEKKARYSSY